MNILVTNDDGISVQGLHVLADTLAKLPGAKVYVVAPDSQRTAASHGMTLFKPLKLTKVNAGEFNGAVEAYACSGYPADCVKVARALFAKRGITFDMVCSGINHGSNLGVDTLYSGTVSAAKEAAIHGIPAFAFSVCSHFPEHFEAFEKLIPDVITKCYGKFPADVVINVNVPNIPLAELGGIAVTRTDGRRYTELYSPKEETDEYVMMNVDADLFTDWQPTEDNDVAWIFKKYVTVAPIQALVSTTKGLEELKTMEFEYE